MNSRYLLLVAVLLLNACRSIPTTCDGLLRPEDVRAVVDHWSEIRPVDVVSLGDRVGYIRFESRDVEGFVELSNGSLEEHRTCLDSFTFSRQDASVEPRQLVSIAVARQFPSQRDAIALADGFARALLGMPVSTKISAEGLALPNALFEHDGELSGLNGTARVNLSIENTGRDYVVRLVASR